MADLKLDVDYSSLKAANQEIERTGTAAEKSARVFERAFAKIAKEEKSAQAQWEKQQRLRIKLMENSARMAEKQAKEEKRANELAVRAVEEQSKAYRNLIRSIDPAEAAVSDFANKVAVLNNEFKDRSGSEYAKRLDQIQQQASRAGVKMDAFGNVLGVTNKNARRTELQMQQAGYQIQDFIVQVQGGVNPLVAFSMQGSQLAGFFAGPWGAAIGLGIAALSSLGIALLGTQTKTKTLSQATEDFLSVVGSYQDASESASSGINKLKEAFGNLATTVKEARDAIKELRELEVEQTFSELSGKFLQDYALTGGGDVRGILADIFGAKAGIKGYFNQQGENVGGEIATILGNVSAANRAESPESRVKFLKDALVQAKELAAMDGKINEKEKELLSILEKMYTAYEGIVEKSGEMESEKKVATAKKLQQIQTDAMALEAEAQQALQEDRVKALAELTQNELDNAKFTIEYRRQKQAEADADKAAEIAFRADQERKLAEENAAYEKKADKERSEKLKQHLDTVFNMNTWSVKLRFVDEENLFSQAVKAKTGKLAPTQSYSELLAMGWTKEDLERIGVTPPKKSGGGSKSDPLADLQKQLDLENRMLGQTEARKRIMQALGDTYEKTSTQTISKLEYQIKTIEDAKKAEEDRLKVQQTVEASFEDGFMSMIDGTKTVSQAFRDMAKEIIAELMRIYVVKKAVAAITTFLPFADGGVFQGGSQVKAFANGGVVGGPTFFPMSGGKTGLMGEAGPEAIMPLKRGKDGKLGVAADGGGSTTVVQNFNFSANGDESVKKIIAQEAPKIAQMTQQQILESRKRGGSFRKAFG